VALQFPPPRWHGGTARAATCAKDFASKRRSSARYAGGGTRVGSTALATIATAWPHDSEPGGPRRHGRGNDPAQSFRHARNTSV
jgi:hypothetical protein